MVQPPVTAGASSPIRVRLINGIAGNRIRCGVEARSERGMQRV